MSYKEEPKIIYADTLSSRRWSVTLILKCGLHLMTSFQRGLCSGDEGSHFIVEKPGKCCLSQ